MPTWAKAAFDPVTVALWGGFWIEVQTTGVAGFDKLSDFWGALAGVMLYNDGLADMCGTLRKRFTYQAPGNLASAINSFNNAYWVRSRGDDIWAKWQKQTGESPWAFVQNATGGALDTPPLNLARKQFCDPCGQVASPRNLSYDNKGKVTF